MILRLIICLASSLLLGGCASSFVNEVEPFKPIEYDLRPAVQPVTGAIYQAGQGGGLFEDEKASQVGDIIVVALVEQTDASKRSATSIAKSSNNNVANPTLAGRTDFMGSGRTLDFDLSSAHEFSGSGDSAQSNSLEGTIAVTVTGVLPSGNLLIEGEKWIRINRGKEYIRLRGLIRPRDVSGDNVILSNRIANAEIYYGGKGEIAQANAAGWLSRFFMSQIWPF